MGVHVPTLITYNSLILVTFELLPRAVVVVRAAVTLVSMPNGFLDLILLQQMPSSQVLAL
jgi:hypothetical protein